MLNRLKTARMRDTAKELIYSNKDYRHAIYGLCYETRLGNIIEELADNKDEIKCFVDDTSYHNCIDNIHTKYESIGCQQLNIYSVHKRE